jgi:hypothetical protein
MLLVVLDGGVAFALNCHLGTLAVGLGCVPLAHGPYHPWTVCHAVLLGIRSLVGFGKARAPLALPVLYPPGYSHDALPK